MGNATCRYCRNRLPVAMNVVFAPLPLTPRTVRVDPERFGAGSSKRPSMSRVVDTTAGRLAIQLYRTLITSGIKKRPRKARVRRQILHHVRAVVRILVPLAPIIQYGHVPAAVIRSQRRLQPIGRRIRRRRLNAAVRRQRRDVPVDIEGRRLRPDARAHLHLAELPG